MSGTRWLDDDQQRSWRSYVEGSALLVDVRDRRLRSRHHLSLADFEILMRLSEAPGGRMRMADLAELSYYSRSRPAHGLPAGGPPASSGEATTRTTSAAWSRR